jgi:hypothetical protein
MSSTAAALALSAGAADERFFRSTAPETLIGLGRRAAAALGTYRVRLVKEERVRGTLLGPQTIEATVREQPRALRLEFVSGPKAGRRVVYDEQVAPGRIHVREAGLLGFMPVWLDLDNPLTRTDTNHRATDVGFVALFDLIDREMDRARPHGGHRREDHGFDANGHWCASYTAPAAARHAIAQRVRLCTDPRTLLPMEAELFDTAGALLERHRYQALRPNVEPSSFALGGAR